MNSCSENLDLASRWKRLAASLIDAVLIVPFLFPILYTLGALESIDSRIVPLNLQIQSSLLAGLLFFLLNAYLLSKHGQTIGKKILNIGIVNLSGKIPPLFPLFTKRYIAMTLLTYIPLFGNLISLIDCLLIFRKDKRCLHDFIAGTTVVNKAST